jgi:hypothetical protein
MYEAKQPAKRKPLNEYHLGTRYAFGLRAAHRLAQPLHRSPPQSSQAKAPLPNGKPHQTTAYLNRMRKRRHSQSSSSEILEPLRSKRHSSGKHQRPFPLPAPSRDLSKPRALPTDLFRYSLGHGVHRSLQRRRSSLSQSLVSHFQNTDMGPPVPAAKEAPAANGMHPHGSEEPPKDSSSHPSKANEWADKPVLPSLRVLFTQTHAPFKHRRVS